MSISIVSMRKCLIVYVRRIGLCSALNSLGLTEIICLNTSLDISGSGKRSLQCAPCRLESISFKDGQCSVTRNILGLRVVTCLTVKKWPFCLFVGSILVSKFTLNAFLHLLNGFASLTNWLSHTQALFLLANASSASVVSYVRFVV